MCQAEEHNNHQEEDLEEIFDRITHPSEFFKHFTTDEFYDWIMKGTYDEIVNVHRILVQYKFTEFANMVVDILLHWNSKNTHG